MHISGCKTIHEECLHTEKFAFKLSSLIIGRHAQYRSCYAVLCSFYSESALNEHITCVIRFVLAELSTTMLSLC